MSDGADELRQDGRMDQLPSHQGFPNWPLSIGALPPEILSVAKDIFHWRTCDFRGCGLTKPYRATSGQIGCWLNSQGEAVHWPLKLV